RQLQEQEKKLTRKLPKEEKKPFALTAQAKTLLRQRTSYQVASQVVQQISQHVQQPIVLDATNFQRHYETRLALPYPVLTNLSPLQIARFEEQSTSPMGFDLEVQSTRVYPYGTTAAHLLGYVQRDDSSAEGEEAFFSYRLPDYRGRVGVEAGYDHQLRGKAGAKSVLVNSVGFRQTENIWSPAEPGQNVVLTIDLKIQQAAERALPVFGPATRGAVVVMDVDSGDLLALVSSPTLNPNHSIQGFPPGEWQRRQDEHLRPQINRATQENYAPGSIFKTVVGLACLEAGLDPNETVYNSGSVQVGKGKPMRDTAPVGHYNFRQALMHSCNTYFVLNGLKAGIGKIVQLGKLFRSGARTGLP